ALSEYSQLSGDTDMVQQLYPVVVNFMDYLAAYRHPDTGLLDLPAGSWAETAYLDTNAGAARAGQSAPLNAMYYHTLLQAANLAGQLGDEPRRMNWQAQAQQVKDAFNVYLYLPEEGRYLTSLLAGQAIQPSVYSLAWPLAYDLVPADQVDRVVAALLNEMAAGPNRTNINVYGLYWVSEALGRSGHIQAGVDMIRNYYGYLLQAGATTWWERFDAGERFYASLSHAWGSAPNWYLTTYVLGARQTGPQEWFLQPGVSDLQSVQGQLPVGDRWLEVDWESGSGCLPDHLTVFSPAGTQGTIVLPIDHRIKQVRYNDVLILDHSLKSANTPDMVPSMSVEVGSGWHVFELVSYCKGDD
ncbi:MAG: hypothetical protein JW862_08760, partial [Anaerolineales bacterium]|nr:hypothetical protein [Anaerolineales bacterium]